MRGTEKAGTVMTVAEEVQLAAPQPSMAEIIEAVIIRGDLSKLTPMQRADYYMRVCHSIGINPLTKPFDYLELKEGKGEGKKLVLYARRDCTDQLRDVRGVSVRIVAREQLNDLYIVTAKAVVRADGREDESVGAVAIAGLDGEALANAIMKAETKAKRRVTLSICGLGLLDETEVDGADGAVSYAMSDEPPVQQPHLEPRRASESGDESRAPHQTGLFVIGTRIGKQVAEERDKDGAVVKKGWTLHRIKFSDGVERATFDEVVYKTAQSAQESGKPISFDGKNDAKGFLLTSMEVLA